MHWTNRLWFFTALAVAMFSLKGCVSQKPVPARMEPKPALVAQVPPEAPPTRDPQATQPENELITKARQALRQGNDRVAEQLYAQYRYQYPEGVYAAESLTQLGLLAFRAARYDSARRYLKQALGVYPQGHWYDTAAVQMVAIDQIGGQTEAVIRRAAELLQRPTLTQAQRVGLNLRLAQAYFDAGDSRQGLMAAVDAYSLATPAQQSTLADEMATLIRQTDVTTHRTVVDDLPPGAARNLLQYQLGMRYLTVGEDDLALETFSALIGNASDSAEAEAARAQMARYDGEMTTKKVALGCLLPLSGPYQAFGQQALAGIEYALLALGRSQLGERLNIKLVVQDTAGESTYAVTAAQALERAGVVAAVGAMVTAEQVCQEMQAAEIPVIALTQQEGIPQIGDYIFRNFITPQQQINALVDYTMSGLGIRHFAILYPEEAYGDHYAELFWEAVKSHAGAVVGAVSYPPGTTDHKTFIARLVGEEHIRQAISRERDQSDEEDLTVDFEALFIPEAAETAALILPQLAYYDVKNVYTLGTHLWHSPKLIEMAGRYSRNSLFPSAFFVGAASSMTQAFIGGFEREFSRTPGLMEAIAYDSAQMIIRAISSLAEITPEGVRDSLQRQGAFDGATGTTWFDDQGEVNKRLSLLTIQNGRFIELGAK
jgi:ABC-type branched-subunit amino acid transport system substrate-binding protein/TolA-binding protein